MSTITDETRTYLGGQGTRDQQQLFQDTTARLEDIYREQWPDDGADLAGMTTAAREGAAQYALGDATLHDLGVAVRRAQQAYADALDTLQGAMVAAHIQGLSERAIADQAGVARETVRKRLGR